MAQNILFLSLLLVGAVSSLDVSTDCGTQKADPSWDIKLCAGCIKSFFIVFYCSPFKFSALQWFLLSASQAVGWLKLPISMVKMLTTLLFRTLRVTWYYPTESSCHLRTTNPIRNKLPSFTNNVLLYPVLGGALLPPVWGGWCLWYSQCCWEFHGRIPRCIWGNQSSNFITANRSQCCGLDAEDQNRVCVC